MKKLFILFTIILVLCGCSEKRLSDKIERKLSDTKEKTEIKIKYLSFLLLYGNEKKNSSYLVSIASKGDSNEVCDIIKLDDYYSSIDQNPLKKDQLVINRNEEKDKSLVLEKNNSAINLHLVDYIETTNTTTFGYGGDTIVLEDKLLGKDMFFSLRLNSDTFSDMRGDEFALIDFTGISFILY